MSDREAIAAIVRDINPSIEIDPTQYDKFLFDLGLDSLDHSTILLNVEEKFGVKIPDMSLVRWCPSLKLQNLLQITLDPTKS